MGRRYAEAAGEDAAVARAIEEHYKPLGPSDDVPSDPVSVAVALADKLDTLVGFWAIDEKPTGSKDPYALRRAALGVIRLVVENGVRLPLTKIVDWHFRHALATLDDRELSNAFVAAAETEENKSLQRLAVARPTLAWSRLSLRLRTIACAKYCYLTRTPRSESGG